MKFDFVIGNPPYQDEALGDNKTYTPPVYNKFLEEAYTISDRVIMIHPARFLFNAGSTPKQWNRKMLNDEHLKVLEYESDCNKYFTNTEIKGGIAITYRNRKKNFGAIETFTPYQELNSIFHKVIRAKEFESLSTISVSSYAYHFTDKMHKDFPDAIKILSKSHAYDLKSNSFDKLPTIFLDTKPKDKKSYIQMVGRKGNRREYKFIRSDYVNKVSNLDKYKVFISSANGNGHFGETLTLPFVAKPFVGATETFFSVGNFDTEIEAESLIKYIKCKFTRALFGIVKVTHHITVETWKYVPFQNFTPNSDIDWSQSIADIDKQLYKKYKLTKSEIAFIESHVKEMK